MLKGSALFFTYLITVGFGLKHLKIIQHFWMIAIVLSLGMIGYSNISSPHEKCNKFKQFRSGQTFTRQRFNNILTTNICIDVYNRIKNNEKIQCACFKCCALGRVMGSINLRHLFAYICLL